MKSKPSPPAVVPLPATAAVAAWVPVITALVTVPTVTIFKVFSAVADIWSASAPTNLASVAALIAAIVAIGGGFVKYGELTTKLQAIEERKGVDIAPIQESIKQLEIKMTELEGKIPADISGSVDKNRTQSKVNEKEIEVLKLQIQELKLKAKNPLAG